MTGPADGFRANPARIAAHAEEVARLAAAVRDGRPSADSLSDDAYGLVGGLFAGSATSAMGQGAAAVGDLAAALSATAEQLRACAHAYEVIDLRVANELAGIDVPAAGGPVR